MNKSIIEIRKEGILPPVNPGITTTIGVSALNEESSIGAKSRPLRQLVRRPHPEDRQRTMSLRLRAEDSVCATLNTLVTPQPILDLYLRYQTLSTCEISAKAEKVVCTCPLEYNVNERSSRMKREG